MYANATTCGARSLHGRGTLLSSGPLQVRDSGSPTVVRAITPAISSTRIISKKHARLALRLARLTFSSRASVRGFILVLPTSYDVTLLSFIDNKTTISVRQATQAPDRGPVRSRRQG